MKTRLALLLAVTVGSIAGAGFPYSNAIIIDRDGGLPTSFATQPPALFTAADCAAALIADGGTLPVGAFLALTRGSLLSDGGWVDPGRPTAAGCEFVQPGANVSHSRFWWTLRDPRDTGTHRLTLANFVSGTCSARNVFREAGVVTPGDFVTGGYQAVAGSAGLAVVPGVGASSGFTNPTSVGSRNGETAFFTNCSVAAVASGDGGTVMVRMSVWE